MHGLWGLGLRDASPIPAGSQWILGTPWCPTVQTLFSRQMDKRWRLNGTPKQAGVDSHTLTRSVFGPG